jgi:Protein of unknown function (DUF3807)
VKRTLTDQQIAIFRHSEMHAELKKQRLQEADIHDREQDRMDGTDAVEEEEVGYVEFLMKEREQMRREVLRGDQGGLDYGEVEETEVREKRNEDEVERPRNIQGGRRLISYEDNQTPVLPVGRRVVSYGDDMDYDDAPVVQSTKKEATRSEGPKTFLWPTIGGGG